MIEILRPREEVAAFAADPSNATVWYKNVRAVEWQTPPPAVLGSRIRFRAQFLGRFGIHERGSRAGAGAPACDGDGPGTLSYGDDLQLGGHRRRDEDEAS